MIRHLDYYDAWERTTIENLPFHKYVSLFEEEDYDESDYRLDCILRKEGRGTELTIAYIEKDFYYDVLALFLKDD